MTTIEEGNVGSWASALSNLKGKRCLVTGASSGIGAAIANSEAPGFVDTAFHDGITSAEERARQVALTPLSRAATPHECVGAYLFLACDQLSSFITGQSLEVNGGWVMR